MEVILLERVGRLGHMGVAVMGRIEGAAEQADLHPRMQVQPVAQGAGSRAEAFRRRTGVEEGQGRLLGGDDERADLCSPVP